MVTITVHGGCSEIGGNKILVESAGTRLMLDFGTRMGYTGEFFSEFLGVRSNTELKDMVTIGALPKIPGVYRSDLILPTGAEQLTNNVYSRVLSANSELLKVPGLETSEDYIKDHGRGYLDAILLSHAHLDHTGDIGFLHSSIPLYCSEVTHTLVKSIDEITMFKSKAIHSKDSTIGFTKTGKTPGSPRLEHKGELVRNVNTLADNEQATIGDFKIRMHSVDHSVPGAASYILACGDTGDRKRILYTGDIRFHGRLGTSIDDYVNAVLDDGPVDIMLCEGTRIGSESRLTEDEVREAITNEIKETTGLVLVDFSWKDTTRYETIREATEAAGKTFVINARLAYLLHKFGQTPLPESVAVFLKRKGSCLYSPSDYSTYKHEYGFSVDRDIWMNDASHYKNGIIAEDIKADPGKYVMMLSYYDLGQLFDIADASGKLPGARFIKAQCEPFCDEMELDEERFINWLDMFGIAYELTETPLPDGCSNPDCYKLKPRIVRRHVSGHVSRPELNELIEKVLPSILIPIHTECPELFQDIAENVSGDIKVRLPVLGEPMEF